jgi:tetratricopeptide (TPR) repeat protein
MPKRPREHQLEELSRRAFRDVLPPRWVYRPVEPDYGIDATVEIFDRDNRATALSFHVQLKATDQADLAAALRSIRFRRDTADYYWSLASPVLVVLFHAPTNRIFARWFHAYNPHVAIHGEREPAQKTVRFALSERDELTSSTPDDLEAGVRGFIRFRSPEIDLPLRFLLSLDPDAQGPDVYRHLFALRTALRPVGDVARVEVGPAAAGEPAIRLGRAGSVVALAEVASVTLDHDETRLADPGSHAVNVAVVIATVLARVGQPNLSARVAAAVAAPSDAILDFDVVFILAGAMVRSRRIADGLYLADALDARDDQDGDARLVAFVLESVILSRVSLLTDQECRLAIELGERKLQRADARGDARVAAAVSYNLAMLHKRRGDAEHAISGFDRAAQLDPSYLDRVYFHSDFAGALFESGAFAEAAERYGEAVARGADGLDIALYGDALLYSGRYMEAEQQLDRYVASNHGPAGAEWRLKRQMLPRIRAVGGDKQDRAVDAAGDLAEQLDFTGTKGDMTPAEAWKLMGRALQLDACCAEAWFRLALLELAASEDPASAVESAVISALLHRYVLNAWTNAISLARMAALPDVEIDDLLRTAYRFNGDEFVVALMQGEEADEPELLHKLDVIVTDMETAAHREGFTMRVPAEDGSMTEFDFRPE